MPRLISRFDLARLPLVREMLICRNAPPRAEIFAFTQQCQILTHVFEDERQQPLRLILSHMYDFMR